MHWINETILSMGGMQACGLTLEKTPTAGTFTANIWTKNAIEWWFWWCNHSHWHDESLVMLSLSMLRCVLFNYTTTAISDNSFIYQVYAVKEKGLSECSCLLKFVLKTTNPHCTRRSQQERGNTFSELVVEDHPDHLSSLFHRNRKIMGIDRGESSFVY